MADLRRVCPGCKRRFRPPKATRRLYCEICRPPRGRVADEPAQVEQPDITGPIEAQCLEQLQAVERERTVEGLVALSVARDLDAGRVAPAQKPGVGQKLAALMGAALQGTAPARRTRVDELAERRAAREAS